MLLLSIPFSEYKTGENLTCSVWRESYSDTNCCGAADAKARIDVSSISSIKMRSRMFKPQPKDVHLYWEHWHDVIWLVVDISPTEFYMKETTWRNAHVAQVWYFRDGKLVDYDGTELLQAYDDGKEIFYSEMVNTEKLIPFDLETDPANVYFTSYSSEYFTLYGMGYTTWVAWSEFYVLDRTATHIDVQYGDGVFRNPTTNELAIVSMHLPNGTFPYDIPYYQAPGRTGAFNRLPVLNRSWLSSDQLVNILFEWPDIDPPYTLPPVPPKDAAGYMAYKAAHAELYRMPPGFYDPLIEGRWWDMPYPKMINATGDVTGLLPVIMN
jgi:hypothetical protein